MPIARIRLEALKKAQCTIFSTVYNPLGLRTGNKVLRQRLKGKLLADWYPRKVLTFQHLHDVFGGTVQRLYDEEEEERLEAITILNARGKGAPKKKRTAADSKKLNKKKK